MIPAQFTIKSYDPKFFTKISGESFKISKRNTELPEQLGIPILLTSVILMLCDGNIFDKAFPSIPELPMISTLATFRVYHLRHANIVSINKLNHGQAKFYN